VVLRPLCKHVQAARAQGITRFQLHGLPSSTCGLGKDFAFVTPTAIQELLGWRPPLTYPKHLQCISSNATCALSVATETSTSMGGECMTLVKRSFCAMALNRSCHASKTTR
jgi:hypothetical protein